MNERVSDITREATLNRLLRENALAALMVLLTLMGLVNGFVIGFGVSVMLEQIEVSRGVQRTVETGLVYQATLIATMRAHGLDVPPPQESE